METVEVEVYEDGKMTEEVESCYTIMEVATPKKRKSKTQEDTVEKPKKPRSAYLLYYFDVHQVMQQDSPNLPQSEINKRISESWKRLNVAEKGYYLEKAKLEKDGVDSSLLSSAQDLPGFRKILPRTSYVLLPKGTSLNHQEAGSQAELYAESLDSPVDAGLSSVSLSQDPQLPPLALGSEVELVEQCTAIEGLAEGTAAMSNSTALHEILPASRLNSTKASASEVASPFNHNYQSSVANASNGLLLRENDSEVAGGTYSIVCMASDEQDVASTMIQPIQAETSQVVTIIPTQNLLEPKTLANASPIGPVMVVTVGGRVDQSSKPAYKMVAKTYTKRGRGRCLVPGCSFVYVTRHKPPICPECGSYLGGKWVPAVKRAKQSAKQSPKNVQSNSSESCQPTMPAADDNNATTNKSNVTGDRKEEQCQQVSKIQHATTTRKPPEGNKTQIQANSSVAMTRPLKAPGKGLTIKGQDRNNVALQKRPVRPILPAYCRTGHTLLQFIAVPPDKGNAQSANNNKSAKVPCENISGLKPSTLKQLGQIVPIATAKQNSPAPSGGSQHIASLINKEVDVLSVLPFKQSSVCSFDLGLSTARGRGHCKNPSCQYVYKNRHKPAQCPSCGWRLSLKIDKGTKSGGLLDPYQALSPAQKDLQRQSTVQLLRRSLQIPESEAELQETMALIQDLNRSKVVVTKSGNRNKEGSLETEMLVRSGWPRLYESAATHCGLCGHPLYKGGQSTVAGQEDCWLLTETLIQTASLQLKVCPYTQCLALHSFTDLYPGLFNIGNRLLVSVDLFLKIRTNIKLGHHPSQAVRTLLDHVPNHPFHAFSTEESSQIQELLLSGYWAFECLIVRDYNDMICGVCGIAPKLEIAQRYTNNVLELKNVEFTWPDFSPSDEVHVDEFWLAMESEAIEQAAFPSDIPITRVDASIIAPFIPPLMRSTIVINTERDKVLSHTQQPSGDPSVLVRLIHEGQLRLDRIEEHSEEELRTILNCCRETMTPEPTKNELLSALVSLYTHVQNGLVTAPLPPQYLTAGKLSKVCPHKVVCGSKYMVRRETARDHIDLLLSSRYWPPVYVTDSAQQVALCADLQYPELASQMWGRNQGCFSDPMDKLEFVSCAELQDQLHSTDLSSVGENQLIHPVTNSLSRWLVHSTKAPKSQEPLTLDHYSMDLCKELEPYTSLVAELEKEREEEEETEQEEQTGNAGSKCTEKSEVDSSERRTLQQPLVFHNAADYYLYNRLIDFLRSRDIVSQQIIEVLRACQPGEVVIRDALYRLGVAQINTEDVGTEMVGQQQEGGVGEEAMLEVVLS
ncbi:HMG domain-containing protein 3 [Lampris incognitus]|uniref:HMG domain-containing protein 3 n=1 Tax=Lampris incognitus TaxID=2546036 RepID=UPI0024B59C52|nr:HMG domain-containing protein 3 [Lampris incognitus]